MNGVEKVHANTTATIIALQNQAGQKELIIEKLHVEVRDLNSKLELTCKERDQTIKQYEQNEIIWKEKYLKKQHECSQVLKLHEQVKEDNRDALSQIEKLVKRVKQLQGDHEDVSKENRERQEKLATTAD